MNDKALNTLDTIDPLYIKSFLLLKNNIIDSDGIKIYSLQDN